MQDYFIIFKESFNRLPLFTISLVILFIITVLIIIFIIFVILLDNLCRPDIPQYSYNFVFDKIIPLILLLLKK